MSNLDKGTVLRIPGTRYGTAGHVETRATGPVDIDDFASTGRGNTLLAAINADNEVATRFGAGDRSGIGYPAYFPGFGQPGEGGAVAVPVRVSSWAARSGWVVAR
ncbi:hypothetical protein JCM4814A_37930 [Streptomyces phaeofaciens JCM 4814]|uniref:Uncharacterized protein n=1 Tax=Streptomyces phaeofaciens TaxID=68254 RepID=A0A918HG25_9ACTN|nr:hypothetical protein [Streptomyces phaeofaciens]GGT58459.1 hypothetical protein GCM10010226_39630 [Streptomyces phaeofaciens]